MWGWGAAAIAAPAPDDFSQADIQEIATLREKAFITSREGDYAAADKLWTQLLEYLPEEPAIWSNRGIVRASQFQLEDAIADYTQAIALAPDEPDSY